MDCLRLCKELTAESGFELGSGPEFPRHQAGLPSTQHVEHPWCPFSVSASPEGGDVADVSASPEEWMGRR